ncbi:type IV secretion system DNA-binding domain-containing protein [Candidatus Desantisbacteria bacterium]|nr:type IV secretion system DNA-binding domain-containing protein [Candidatus Desantisbacteria bacterium]
MYIIGKTGTGKSTLISHLIKSDIQNNEGFALIDPHGDLAEKILRMIPDNRKDDVMYFNPGDRDHKISFNILEYKKPEDKYLVASGLISIMKKLWAEFWGPRLEHILRNTVLTILEFPQMGTLFWIPKLLTDDYFRKEMICKVLNKQVKEFWFLEFEKYSPAFRKEAVSPILNKVGQFLSNPHIARIFTEPKSSFDIRDIMDNGKIFIANLAKGKIGEDNATLLGAMLTTKMELTALSRANIPENGRKDFYLYADEFPCYITESFSSALSQVRKYGLCLILANQYLNQLDDKTRGAIFGNVGTIISFRVGAEDAEYLASEFYPEFNKNDFIDLPYYHIYLRMMINGVVSKGFSGRVIN